MNHKRAYLRYMNCLLNAKLLTRKLEPQRIADRFDADPDGPCIRIFDNDAGQVIEGENYSMSLEQLEHFVDKLH